MVHDGTVEAPAAPHGVAAVHGSGRSMLLEGLPDEELRQVESRLEIRMCPAGTVLLSQGTWQGVLYLVRSGILSVDVTTAQGEIRHLAKLVPGECAGEMSLLTGMPVSATVSVLADATLGALRQVDFMELLGICPTLARNVSVVLSQRLSTTIRGEKPGFARLMRVRVHPDVPAELPKAIARSVCEHLGMSLLVVDHRLETNWSPAESLPPLDSLLDSQEPLEVLRSEREVRPVATSARGISAETWARFEASLPHHVTRAVQLVQTDQMTGSLLANLSQPDVDVTLWPEEQGPVPGGIDEVGLLTAQQGVNSRAALERAGNR